MTRRLSDTQMGMVAAYLDGTLDGAQRTQFELALEHDAALQAELKFQRELDGSLTRLFEPPAAIAEGRGGVANAALEAAPATNPLAFPRSRWRLAAWIAAAAALLLAAGITYYMMNPRDPNLLTPEQVYARMELANFKPAWTCKDDQQFMDTVQNKLGEKLLVPGNTPGLQVVGWAYAGGYIGYPISPDTMVLITKKDNDNVLLFIDRAASDRKLKLASGSNLHLFRDTSGGLVMYEVTPRTEPVVIPVAKANKPTCASPNGRP